VVATCDSLKRIGAVCVGNVKVEREYMVMKALKQVRAHASQSYMDSGP